MTMLKRAIHDLDWTGECSATSVSSSTARPAGGGPAWPATFVAEVTSLPDAAHPGRLLCRWSAGKARGEHWLPTTRGVVAQVHDRILCVRAEGSPEPIVTAVIDGLVGASARPAASSPRLRLQADEALCIEGADGTPLVEVRAGAARAVVTVLQHETEIALAGALAISATSVAIEAREGDLALVANGDAKVTAEIIHLN